MRTVWGRMILDTTSWPHEDIAEKLKAGYGINIGCFIIPNLAGSLSTNLVAMRLSQSCSYYLSSQWEWFTFSAGLAMGRVLHYLLTKIDTNAEVTTGERCFVVSLLGKVEMPYDWISHIFWDCPSIHNWKVLPPYFKRYPLWWQCSHSQLLGFDS